MRVPTPDPTPASSLTAHEDHLRALGLPLVIAPATRRREVLPRSAGVGAGLAVAATGIAAVDRSNDYMIALLERAGPGAEPDLLDAPEPIAELLLLAVALWVAAPLVGWLVSTAARRARPVAGSAIGLGALIALVVVPHVVFDPHDGPSYRTTVLLAVGVLVGTYTGLGSLVRWSARRVRRELATMGPMVARVLPILMLAVLFLFFSVEIWQVMVELSWPRTFAVLGVMVVLTVLLVGISTRDDILQDLGGRAPDHPLRPGERVNLVLVPVLATLIQAALFATLVFLFFVTLGWIAVPEITETRWTLRPPDEPGGLLFGLPVSVTLVRVSLMLATFSALNLAAAAASDAAHKERFVRPMLDEVVRGLAAREAYLGARRRGLP